VKFYLVKIRFSLAIPLLQAILKQKTCTANHCARLPKAPQILMHNAAGQGDGVKASPEHGAETFCAKNASQGAADFDA